jgi:hypothetical protein
MQRERRKYQSEAERKSEEAPKNQRETRRVSGTQHRRAAAWWLVRINKRVDVAKKEMHQKRGEITQIMVAENGASEKLKHRPLNSPKLMRLHPATMKARNHRISQLISISTPMLIGEGWQAEPSALIPPAADGDRPGMQ